MRIAGLLIALGILLMVLVPGPAMAEDGPNFEWRPALWQSTDIVVVDFPSGCTGAPRIIERLRGSADEADLPAIPHACRELAVWVDLPDRMARMVFEDGCDALTARSGPSDPLSDSFIGDCVTPTSPRVLFLLADGSGLQWVFGPDTPDISMLWRSPTGGLLGLGDVHIPYGALSLMGTASELESDTEWIGSIRAQIDATLRDQSGDQAARSLLALGLSARGPSSQRVEAWWLPHEVVTSLGRVHPTPSAAIEQLLLDPEWIEHHATVIERLPKLLPEAAPRILSGILRADARAWLAEGVVVDSSLDRHRLARDWAALDLARSMAIASAEAEQLCAVLEPHDLGGRSCAPPTPDRPLAHCQLAPKPAPGLWLVALLLAGLWFRRGKDALMNRLTGA